MQSAQGDRQAAVGCRTSKSIGRVLGGPDGPCRRDNGNQSTQEKPSTSNSVAIPIFFETQKQYEKDRHESRETENEFANVHEEWDLSEFGWKFDVPEEQLSGKKATRFVMSEKRRKGDDGEGHGRRILRGSE